MLELGIAELQNNGTQKVKAFQYPIRAEQDVFFEWDTIAFLVYGKRAMDSILVFCYVKFNASITFPILKPNEETKMNANLLTSLQFSNIATNHAAYNILILHKKLMYVVLLYSFYCLPI